MPNQVIKIIPGEEANRNQNEPPVLTFIIDKLVSSFWYKKTPMEKQKRNTQPI